MKRHGNLWEKIVSLENLHAAHLAARKGKRHYVQVKRIDDNIEQNLLELQHLLNEGKFRTGKYTRKTIIERGKEREIFSLPYWPDRVVQHAVVQILSPIWLSQMVRGTYASIPGRGILDAKNRVVRDLRNYPDGTKYCLKIDIKKFYPSINHEKMKWVLAQKIKDKKVLNLLNEVVDSIDVSGPQTGIPIGNYLSQWFANIYLAELDWKIKQEFKIQYYHRYCDDIVMLHYDSSYLHAILREITIWLKEHYKLSVKESWQITQSAINGIDFIGYRMWAEKILIRKAIKKRMAKRLSLPRNKRSSISFELAVKSLPSYNGWLSHGSTLKLRNKILLPYIEMELI